MPTGASSAARAPRCTALDDGRDPRRGHPAVAGGRVPRVDGSPERRVSIVRTELRLLRHDPVPAAVLVGMPLVLMTLLSDAMHATLATEGYPTSRAPRRPCRGWRACSRRSRSPSSGSRSSASTAGAPGRDCAPPVSPADRCWRASSRSRRCWSPPSTSCCSGSASRSWTCACPARGWPSRWSPRRSARSCWSRGWRPPRRCPRSSRSTRSRTSGRWRSAGSAAGSCRSSRCRTGSSRWRRSPPCTGRWRATAPRSSTAAASSDVLGPVGVLIAFTLAFAGLALWRFRLDEPKRTWG